MPALCRTLAFFSLAAPLLVPTIGAQTGAPLEDLRRHVPLVDNALELTLADLDGDGAPELAFGTVYGPRFLWNDGHGRLTALESPFAPFPPGADVPGARTAAGDLDGDGDVDLFLGWQPAFNDGTGRLQVVPGPVPSVFQQRAVLLADVDGDEDLDAVLGSDYQTWLLRNDGEQGFVDVSAQLPQDGVIFHLAEADVDLDGDVDLVRDGVLLRNDGQGTFTEDPLAIPGARTLAFADGDGDGFPDLFVRSSIGPIRFLRNLDGVLFEELAVLPDSTAFSVADFDGDGDVDVLSVYPPFLAVNDGQGVFSATSEGLPPELEGYGKLQAAADVDRDGDLDVLALRSSGGPRPLRLWLGDGQGGFLEAQRHVPAERFEPLVLLDVDGDGDQDVVGKSDGERTSVRCNDGNGVLTPAPEILDQASPYPDAKDAAAGDVDDDGDQDLLLAMGGQDLLFINAGRDGLIDETTARAALESRYTRAVELADFDDDGDLDAFLANSGRVLQTSYTSTFWRNDGDGFFADDSGVLPQRFEVTRGLAVGDVDGDGVLDVLLANSGQNVLLRGDGAGGFEDATASLPVDGLYKVSYDAGLADFDGDGDLDAYLADAYNATSPGAYEGGHKPLTNRVLINEGGQLLYHPGLHTTGDVGYEVVLADFDGDADVDVLVGTALWRAGCCRPMGGETLFYRNEGGGTLGPGETLTGYLDLQLAAGDLDGDGDVDVVTPERVLTNIERSLAWVALPRAGRPLELAVTGPGGAPLLLLSADRPAAIATDRGVLRVDLSANGLLVPATLGPHGRFVFRFPVPDSFAGETLYWQALVGGEAARFTNLELTSFVAH